MERAVGVFVMLATVLLLAGFAYYVYHTGQRKGWWTFRARFHTFIDSGAGLSAGGDVRLLGFSVGRVTEVTAMPPGSVYPVYVEFFVLHPYEGFIWSDSKVRVAAGDFLGGRFIEVIPGGSSLKTDSNAVLHASYKLVNGKWKVFNDQTGEYDPFDDNSKGYPLIAIESPAVTERLENLANQAEQALPGILDMTNRLNLVLSNAASLTSQAQTLLAEARPTLTNVAVITANLRDPKGSLGEWVLPTNLHTQILQALATANTTLTNANDFISHTDTNLTSVALSLDDTLINLANITSNLNQQVQSNTNLLKYISDLVTNSDTLVQGLKHHWLLRSAFKEKKDPAKEQPTVKTNAPAPAPKAGKWR